MTDPTTPPKRSAPTLLAADLATLIHTARCYSQLVTDYYTRDLGSLSPTLAAVEQAERDCITACSAFIASAMCATADGRPRGGEIP